MLVYANTFWIKTPENNLDSLLSSIDQWLAKKTSHSLSVRTSINAGVKRGNNGHEIDVTVSGDAEGSEYVLASIIYSHPDPQVSGRKWFTRIGARLFPKACNTQISVVIETSDISVQSGSASVTASRPGVVTSIIRHCGLLDAFPSNNVEHLSLDNVHPFIAEVETPSRKYAIILISPDSFTERLLLDPLDILDQVVGLGKVFCIDNKNNGKELSLILGRRRSAWDGAVNIIYPTQHSGFTPTHLLSGNEIKRIQWEGKSFSRYLLHLLTHRLNLLNFREEITPAHVREYALNLRLKDLEAKGHELNVAQQVTHTLQETSDAQKNTIKGLEELISALKEKIIENEALISRTKAEADGAMDHWIEAQEQLEAIPALKAQIANYREAFKKIKSDGRLQASEEFEASTVGEAIENASDQFPDALVFSFNSKSEDKDSPFEAADEVVKAFDWLVNRYRASKLGEVQIPRFDHDLKQVLSNWDYSAKQSDHAKGSCREWYETLYCGRKITIEENLKCGRSRNPQETIRIAFAWDDEKGKVVIGYIGQHQENSKS